VDDAKQRADWHLLADAQPGIKLLPAPAVHADFPSLTALAAPHQDRTTVTVQVALSKGESLADTKAGTPKDDDQAPQTRTR